MSTADRKDKCDAWYDGSAICVIAVGAQGDPLDLGENEAEILIGKIQNCIKQANTDDSSNVEEQLDEEANKIQKLLAGKSLSRVLRPRENEVVLEFKDGTRLFINTKGKPEFSVT
jgi:hypothetical protein